MQVEHVEITCRQPEAGVIFLHGLGASGYDFVPWIETFFPKQAIHWRLPHAPVRPVTWLGGQAAPAWYDLFEATTRSREDLPGLKLAQAMVNQQISELVAIGIPYDRIFLLGFSQGAALALFSGLQFAEKLAGIGAFSGYLPARQHLEMPHQQNVWLSHGDLDAVLPMVFYEIAQAQLQASTKLTANVYAGMEHTLNQQCSVEFVQWFQTRIKKG